MTYICGNKSIKVPRFDRNILVESTRKLDELNQAIWDSGFTTQTLTALTILAQEVNHGATLFERIPQAQQPGLSKGSSILTSAGLICRGCPGTESEVREIYHTDDLIGEGRIQERLVEVWARITGCWYESPDLYLSSLSDIKDYGTESVVYFDVDNLVVRKLISLKHYNVLRLALDRIIIHNAVFTDSAMKVLGFGRNEDGQFRYDKDKFGRKYYTPALQNIYEYRCRDMRRHRYQKQPPQTACLGLLFILPQRCSPHIPALNEMIHGAG